MRTKSKLASTLAVAVAIGVVVYLWSGERGGDAAEAQAAQASVETEVAPQFADDERRDAVANETPEKTEANALTASAQRIDIAPWEPPKFEYELEVRVFDEADQPGLKEPILIAPAGHTLNEVGAADLEGRLVVKWLAFEPRMQVDVSLRNGEGLRRVDVAAGFTSVALPNSRRSDTNWQDRKVINLRTDAKRADLKSIGSRFFEVPNVLARRDAEGRVLFVEPLLYGSHDSATVLTAPSQEVRDASAGTLDRLTVNLKRSSPEESPQKGVISVRIVDADGQPVDGAFPTARLVGDGARASTLGFVSGAIQLRNLQPGEWDVRAGGGNLGRASARLRVVAGRTTEWTAVLDRGAELKARLVDATHAPLAGWKVLVETLGRTDALVDSATTDDEGRFAIPNLPTQPLRLLARRERAAVGSELLVATSVWAAEREQEFVLDTPSDSAPGPIQMRMSCAEGTPPGAARVCAWREETGHAILGRVESDQNSSLPFASLSSLERQLLVSGLEPGWYTLEIAAVAREPLGVRSVFVSGSQVTELPALLATAPASLALGGVVAPEDSTLSLELVHRGATVELLCFIEDSPGSRGFLRPGDYSIVRTLGEKRLERWLRAEAGTVSELE